NLSALIIGPLRPCRAAARMVFHWAVVLACAAFPDTKQAALESVGTAAQAARCFWRRGRPASGPSALPPLRGNKTRRSDAAGPTPPILRRRSYAHARCLMSFNSFGRIFRVTTWGESHGPALGATVDGCPPGVKLEASAIQHWLDRPRPGQSRYTTQRREPDEVE